MPPELHELVEYHTGQAARFAELVARKEADGDPAEAFRALHR